ncbi:MAG: nucleotidyltransferase family protein [Pirellulales bacterium]|nr:nucleotidyltransferase family protein [Pirellulales bacterium]
MQSFAIVPAAGRSRRMGQPKLLLEREGRPLIEYVLAAWRESQIDRVVVVVHPEDDELAQRCRRAGAEVVRPAAPPPEMKDSVAQALGYVDDLYQPAPGDVWLLAPADMPALSPGVIDAVLAAHRAADAAIIVPTHQGKRGHPVLFPWPLAQEVSELGQDEGIHMLVARHVVRELELPSSEILLDVDRPEDFARWANEGDRRREG